MRAVPCEAPSVCPGPNCSNSTTSTPRRASAHAVAEPITPPPTTTTSVNRGVPGPSGPVGGGRSYVTEESFVRSEREGCPAAVAGTAAGRRVQDLGSPGGLVSDLSTASLVRPQRSSTFL